MGWASSPSPLLEDNMANKASETATPVAQPVAVTEEREAHLSELSLMKRYFDAQPKEQIRIAKDKGEQFVQVNGYSFAIQAGVPVRVPRQVAEMLRDADII